MDDTVPTSKSSPGIFLSQTHSDTPISDALRDLIHELCGHQVTVQYSTNKESDGSIRPGEDWLRWIEKHVREAYASFILLTPSSIQKPWILWEAGAVAGAALATSADHLRRVRPLVFRLKQSEIPSPFHHVQVTKGDSKEDMEHMLSDLLASLTTGSQTVIAGRKMDASIAKYLEAVDRALLNAPLTPTEASVQEWCLRLDELKSEGRMSEVSHLHDWMNVAFGRDKEGIPRPIDVRIHRRLGQLYLAARQYLEASEQLELARQAAPRDILILRTLGQAYLGQMNLNRTTEIVALIEALDATAFLRNVECATLKGRLFRHQGNVMGARDTYLNCFAVNSQSYYLTDLIAQMELQLGNVEKAKAAYSNALAIINTLQESNVWVHATAATAALANSDEATARGHIRKLKLHGPSLEQLNSIEDGMTRVATALKTDKTFFAAVRAALRDPQYS